MHGLIGLIIFGVIAFFVIRAMFFSGRAAVGVPVRQITPSYNTTGPDDDADDDDDPEMRELEELERQEREGRRAGVPAPVPAASNPFATIGLPKGLGGVIGTIASVAAVGAIAAITDGEVDFDMPDFTKKLRATAAEAKLAGEPIDLKAVVAQVAGAVEAAATPGGGKKKPHTGARHNPSGDDAGILFGVRPPLDARPPLAPLGPAKALAPFHPVKVLAERAPISV